MRPGLSVIHACFDGRHVERAVAEDAAPHIQGASPHLGPPRRVRLVRGGWRRYEHLLKLPDNAFALVLLYSLVGSAAFLQSTHMGRRTM